MKTKSGRNVFGAIEAGGTKFVCAVRTGPDDLAITQSSTDPPEPMIARAVTNGEDAGIAGAAALCK